MNQNITNQVSTAVKELVEAAKFNKGDLFIIGCSSSEIVGERIGKGSNMEAAETVYEALAPLLKEAGLYMAVQCCEHLNRAVILEREAADKFGWEEVNAVPHAHAGGAFATIAYHRFTDPVAVEHVRAVMGMDIGDTLIGMHLQEVAVPVRTSVKKVGEANLVTARTRAKFVGGARAQYNEKLQ
ncbi:MAG TPA: TIGR01440 family protein [Clostridiales bacterium]|jgi:uncharacterized protein (TIGR01440 family)|nr:TIGR01440 family protein [Clostridiales bacterium]HCG36256.1 TIGR01440 family protein [Clostridiales bacterium]